MTLQDIEPSQCHSSAVMQPSSGYMDLKEPRKDNRKAQSTSPGYEPPRPAKRSWEVPRHHVTIEKVICKSAFGQVAKGTAVGLQGRSDTTTVAIKMLRCESCTDFRTFLTEFFVCVFFLLCISLTFAFNSPANAAESYERELMKELETMKKLERHPHIIKLLGCVTESGMFWLRTFFMPYAFSL